MFSTLSVADAVLAQLSLQFINLAGGTSTPDVIFITDDATYNRVTLQIALTSGSVTLSPGTIPDPTTPPSTGTTLYLDLSGLQLSASVWSTMTFAGKGWTFQTFPSQGVVGMTPTTSIPLTSGTSGAIAITIGGLVVPAALPTPQVQIYASYYGVPTVTGNYISFAVAVRNRPDDTSKNLADALGVTLSANGIVNSIMPLLQAGNLFSLQFVSQQQAQVQAGPNTLFSVTFAYGAPTDRYGFGALTDVGNAQQIKVLPGVNAAQWTINDNPGAQSPYWTLQPPNGAPIVGTGVQSIVGIDFSNIVTTYQPGPTVMLVSYADVPGYQDGTFVLVLNKVAHAQVSALAVTPNPAHFSHGSAKVTVSWTTAGAQILELTQNGQTTPVTGETQTTTVLEAERTVFTLKATGAPGTVANEDYQTVSAIALPVINSFTGAPTEIYSGSLSHDARFAWAVDSIDGVKLSSTGDAFSGQSFEATDSTSASIREPQMVTLAPTTAANPLTLTRRLVISAFTPAPQTYPLPFTPAVLAASPSGPFIAIAGPSGSLTIVDTVQYAVVSTIPMGHVVTAMAFSADGSTLATANADKTASVVGVGAGTGGLPVFGAPSTVSLSAAPQQVIFAPNGSRVFVTVDPGGGANGQVVSLTPGSSGYQIEATNTVGKAPRGLTLDAAGARLFVANSGDDTVCAIGLTQQGTLGGVTMTCQVAGGPTGLAATPSGQQLLVSCATAGKVVVIDPDHPQYGQRNTLTVGSMPGPIAITPTGGYAFVANTGSGTLSLIDCWGLPSDAEVLGSPIAVGSSGSTPTGINISPDGLQVLVANANGFTLVTLATYRAAGAPVSMPNRPTSAAATPDGLKVFLWHDASIPAQAASPGILAYSTTSGLSTNVLANKNVLRCVASPDPLAKQAFAIVSGDLNLYVIATDTLDTTSTTLGLVAGTAPVALAIDGEGETLFVVAADANRNLSLVVLTQSHATWQAAGTATLYTATKSGRILLQSTPDGTTLFLLDIAGATVRVIRKTGSAYALSPTAIPADATALDVAILPDGSTAYVLNAGQTTNTITVVDLATLTSDVVAIPQAYVNLQGIEASPDGRRLFATDSNAAALRLIDPQSIRILQTIPLAADPSTAAGAAGLAVMPDGSKIFTANTVSQTLGIVEQTQMGTSSVAGAMLSRRLSLGDQPYSGLFIRHYMGETPGAPTDGWSASPDAILFGATIQPDLTQFTSQAGYATDFGSTVNTGGTPNNVYFRGLNTTAAPITSRAYFYYTQGSLALWPADWRSDQVTVNTVPQNWVDITAPATGVGVCSFPLVWTPQQPPGGDHYCVIGWVVNGANPQPPPLSQWNSFATLQDLINFIVSNHNMAWRNTVDVPQPPPDFSYNTAVGVKSGGGTLYLSITWVGGLPMDGSFAVNLQGPDPNNSIAVPKSPLSQYQGGYSPRSPLVFPPNFSTSLQVYHWPGATPVPPTAKIQITLGGQVAPSLQRDIERMYRPRGLRTPIRRFAGINIVIIGSVTFNLLFGSSGRAERVR